MPEIYRRAWRHFAPWKNGGGRTAEILAAPGGAGLDDFAWRISTAEVAASGPFSIFPRVERCLAIIEGDGLRLDFADGTLLEAYPGEPVYFPGDAACDCKLLGSQVLDLNVMVRSPWRARVSRADGVASGQHCFLFALEDVPELGLERHDLAEIAAQPVAFPGRALLIEIFTA